MHDLLTSPLISIVRNNGRDWVTLTQLFAELVEDRVEAFPGLPPHQSQAWYQFLAQSGALALLNAKWRDHDNLPDNADTWRELLKSLTPDCADTAWSLVITDAAKPAFLQPPTTEIDRFGPLAETPDGLDILVTAKNHDRKQATSISDAPHRWIYGLVILQTASGFAGRGNYGIARMNGGLSSRMMIDRRPNHRWGPRVCRAIRMLLARRKQVMDKRGGERIFNDEDEGLGLAWLKPWDSDAQLRLEDLDPYFIEVSRRVRLVADEHGRISALGRPSNKSRTDAAALKGNLADPWVPVVSDGQAMTVSANGFDYRLAQRILLSQEFLKPLALRDLPGEPGSDTEIHMAVLVRGQGKTEGLHERIIKLPYTVAEQLHLHELDTESDEPSEESSIAALSQDMISRASETRRVLRQALLIYLQGPEKPDFQASAADPVIQRFDRLLDEHFFDVLFRMPADGYEATQTVWQELLRREALRLADEVWASGSAPSTRREKARAASEAVLWGGLRRQLPLAMSSRTEPVEAAA